MVLASVPWLDRPVALYSVPAPRPIAYSTSAQLCRAADLRVRQGRHGVGLGNELEELVFRNVGPTTCLLRGYPSVSGVGPGRVRRVLHARHGGTYFGTLAAAD